MLKYNVKEYVYNDEDRRNWHISVILHQRLKNIGNHSEYSIYDPCNTMYGGFEYN